MTTFDVPESIASPDGGFSANQDPQAMATALERVHARLRVQLGETAWRRWIQPMGLVVTDGRTLSIEWPSRFMRDWVDTHYADRIREAARREWPQHTVVFAVASASKETKPVSVPLSAQPQSPQPSRKTADIQPSLATATVYQPPISVPPISVAASAKASQPARAPRAAQAPVSAAVVQASCAGDFGAPLDGRYTFDNFIVGKPNELAYAAAFRVADQPGVTINPLFLYGGVGLGKTHLMHAIAWHIQRKTPNRRVLYMSAEKFMFQFIRAIRDRDTTQFKEQFRTIDLLMIDDVQFFSGKDNTQEEFFHTFNALVDQNRQVVISADKSPSDLHGMEERLRSRLGWGLCADIHPTTYELRLGILEAKAAKANLPVPEKVIQFLAHRIASNVRELEGAFNRIVAHSELVGREITLEGAQEVLADLLRANERRLTVEEIQKRVAEHFNIKLADMQSDRRSRQIARPRQVAMFLSKTLTSRSLPEIGRRFGGRDHTTVIHAVRKVEELISVDQGFADDIELLKRLLQA